MTRAQKIIDIAGRIVAIGILVSFLLTAIGLFMIQSLDEIRPGPGNYADLAVLPSLICGLSGLIITIAGLIFRVPRAALNSAVALVVSLFLFIFSFVASLFMLLNLNPMS